MIRLQQPARSFSALVLVWSNVEVSQPLRDFQESLRSQSQGHNVVVIFAVATALLCSDAPIFVSGEAAETAGNAGVTTAPHRLLRQDGGAATNSTAPRVPQMWRPRPNSDDIVLVMSHYKEDTSWTARQPYDYVVRSQCCLELGPKLEPDWNTQLGFQRGTESTAYLSFIVDNYDQLPKHMVFMHAHDVGWHQIVSHLP